MLSSLHRSMHIILVVLVSLSNATACKLRSAALSKNTSKPVLRPPSGLGFKPVLLVDDGGDNMDPRTRDLFMTTFLRATARAFEKLSVQTDAKQNNLALFAAGLKFLDTELAVEFQSPQIRAFLADQNASGSIAMKLIILDADEAIPEAIAQNTVETTQEGSMAPIARLMQLAAPRTDVQTFETFADITNEVMRMPIVRLYSPQANTMLAANTRTYLRISAQKNSDWMPMQVTIDLSMQQNSVFLSVDTRIKPGAGSQQINRMGGAIGIRVLDYAPRLTGASDQPSVAQFSVTRLYKNSGVDAGGIQAKVRFGRLMSRDQLNTILQCGQDCREEAGTGAVGRYYPTIRGEFNYDAVSGEIPEALRPTMRTISQGLASWNSVSIIARSVGLDLRDPCRPRVVSDRSSFAIVLGSNANSIQLSRESSFTLDGLDLYRHIAESQIAPQLSDDVRARLRDANDHSSQSMSEQLDALAQLFALVPKN